MKLIAASVAIVVVVPTFFFFGDLFYDQNGPWMDLWSQKVKTYISSARHIEQTIASQNDKFSKLTIPIMARKETLLDMTIINKNGALMRTKKINTRANQQRIEWEFEPLSGLENIYIIKIAIPKTSQKNIVFFLIPANAPGEQALIDNQTMPNKRLAYFTEAKFDSIQEKLKTLFERIKVYKPKIIQLALLPLFSAYVLMFPIAIWMILKIVLNSKNKYDR